MAVKIKLARIGKIREPHYRIVVADARTRRNGRAIETIGQYHPKENPSRIEVNSDLSTTNDERVFAIGDVRAGSVSTEVMFAAFDDYWEPFMLGVGPAGDHVATLDEDAPLAMRMYHRER